MGIYHNGNFSDLEAGLNFLSAPGAGQCCNPLRTTRTVKEPPLSVPQFNRFWDIPVLGADFPSDCGTALRSRLQIRYGTEGSHFGRKSRVTLNLDETTFGDVSLGQPGASLVDGQHIWVAVFA